MIEAANEELRILTARLDSFCWPGIRCTPLSKSNIERTSIGGSRMAQWKPDPTFYPSPRLAMQAPAEKLAYVAVFNPKKDGPDAITVVDLAPDSPDYGKLVGRVDMPKAGDELHHFGWN